MPITGIILSLEEVVARLAPSRHITSAELHMYISLTEERTAKGNFILKCAIIQRPSADKNVEEDFQGLQTPMVVECKKESDALNLNCTPQIYAVMDN